MTKQQGPAGGALICKSWEAEKTHSRLSSCSGLARPSALLPQRNKEQRPAEARSQWRRFSETNRGLLVVKDAVALPQHHENFRLGCRENNSCWYVEQPCRFISSPSEWRWCRLGGEGEKGEEFGVSECEASLIAFWSPTTWRRQRHTALAEELASEAW